MLNTVLDCSSHAWPMIAGGALTFGVLALAGAALLKYLFFADPSRAAA